MKENKFKYLILLTLTIISCVFCKNHAESNRDFQIEKKKIHNDLNDSSLFSFFPKEIKSGYTRMRITPMDTTRMDPLIGFLYLTYSLSNPGTDLDQTLSKDILYSTNYNEENMIIDVSELNKNRFPISKCNKYLENKYPIPYFENWDFGLGESKTEKMTDDNGKTYYQTYFNIPSDLKVYVLSSNPENPIASKFDVNRPESLKVWKHGYSSGIAVSKKENLVMYWFMQW